jgi:hypothetical protein
LHKRLRLSPKNPRIYDPTGAETSDDPNDDDDAWDDLDGDDIPDAPILACLWEMAPHWSAPGRTPVTRAVADPPSFRSRQRLRC